jgi:redox-sensitive bicupin YhaK (pirin superfamily)
VTDTSRSPLAERLEGTLHVIPAAHFHRLTELEFGMPGLVAIESVGPFVELAKVGPFITIHDSFLAPGLGIGHHPHQGNERLFYILRGEIHHDDSLNGITGTMAEGDLARLTEGERGMFHREWNGREHTTTHAFILVYTPDVDPPIPTASFAALRARDIRRVREADGAETLELIGGRSAFRANTTALTAFLDTTLADDATIDTTVPARSGLIVYPLGGDVLVEAEPDGPARLAGRSDVHPEGPDAIAIAWADDDARSVRLTAVDGAARVIRLGFARRSESDLVVNRPWVRNRG